MNDPVPSLARLYSRLGLNTDAEIVARRESGAARGAENLELKDLPDLMSGLFQIGQGGEGAYLTAFEEDPGFEVRVGDKEAVLLAAVIADHALEDEELSGPTALTLRSVSFGGVRSLEVENGLLNRADNMLSKAQSEEAALPTKRNKSPVPASLDEAIEAVEAVTPQQIGELPRAVHTALQELMAYVANASQADVTGHNRLRAHIERLEKETRTHWWVTGGWSALGDKLFGDLPLPVAIVFSALELQEQHDARTGLYAAPALLQLILERKRDNLPPLSITDIATGPELSFRKERFGSLASSDKIGLFPLSSALGLAADADDEDDWKAAFRRKVGLDTDRKFEPLQLTVQLYHESLLRGLIGD